MAKINHRIGIFPGTFNPIHEGHVAFALEAIKQCSLDQVILLPERSPRGKKGVADFDARVVYINKILQNTPSSITAKSLICSPQTIEAVTLELEEYFSNNTITLLIGSDVAKGLGRWKNIDALLNDHELCVGLRGDESKETVLPYINELEKDHNISAKVTFVSTPYSDISSTQIRNAPGYQPL